MMNPFYPVAAGRTSDAQARHRTLHQVQVGKLGIHRLEDQLATGRRILAPSDDPTASIRVMQMQRELEFRDQAKSNLQTSTQFLNATESSLANIQGVLNELRGLTVSASTNLNSEAERVGLLSDISTTLQRLMASVNTQFQDRYLFSGSAVRTPTVEVERGAIRFLGNESDLLTISESGQYVPHNVTGQRALGLVSSGVVSTADLAPAAVGTSRLEDLNGGRGVAPGAVHFSDGVDQVTVDLSSAASLNDVLALIHSKVSLGGRPIAVALQPNGSLRVNYQDGLPGTLRISNVGAGQTASDLGIATTEPAPTLPIQGPALDPLLRLNTRLSQLNQGAGFDTSGGFRITQGDRTYTIVLGTAATIEDMFNAIRRSGAAVEPDITPDGRSIRLRSTQSGTDFSIGENGGLLATRLGLRTLTAETRLDQLNHGRGVSQGEGAEIMIHRNDGTQFSVDLTGSVTIGDLLNRINNNVANVNAATKVTASLNALGNGITVSSVLPGPLTPNPQPFAIEAIRGNQALWDLGLIPIGADRVEGTLTPSDTRIVGTDPNPQEVRGIFNSLLRFQQAVEKGDIGAIGRVAELVSDDLARLTSSRASLGVSLQQIDDLTRNHEDRFNDLKESESRLLDADLAATITELNGRQVAYEAGLKLLANSGQMNLFDFI